VKVRIEHYSRNGKLKRVYKKENDRVLNNFGYLLKAIFYPINKGANVLITGFVDEYGRSFGLQIGLSSYTWDYVYEEERKYYCEIGTGTTAPANSDYKLENYHNRGVAEIYSLDLGADKISITLRASVQATANVTINEVGLSLHTRGRNVEQATWVSAYVLLFRDVLSEGISMLSGEYLAVYYTIEFTR